MSIGNGAHWGPSGVQPVAVELRGVIKEYGSRQARVRALDGVSVAFPTGTWTAVMGPSGSGKSTLLHCAAGLEKVDAGQVLVAGANITNASAAELTALRRGRVGFVFQTFNLVSSLTAEQNVELPLKLAGARTSRREVRRVLEAVGLGDRTRHKPGELSGGQQQRVAIARAMVSRPAVLFADEPTGALDSKSARDVLALLETMVSGSGQTIVMVTHDPTVAASATTVVFLRDGQVVDSAIRPSAHEVAGRLARLEH
ncbi:ABC transporter ATP-binding protein [Umezawaea sp. NPDC059074]|uniref:ABC transporter ATP-binding protein n=1 Tax=Umezawaea sp. NPDC059074 TaxID=3346716 RepID=UPI0036C48A44